VQLNLEWGYMSKLKLFLLLQFIFFSVLPVLAQVDTAWIRRYNGPWNDYDYASAVAVDPLGNVYVTGYSWGSGTAYDYATIKYAPNGDTLWVRLYNGPRNDHDYANALTLDSAGNVYVTGRSEGSGTYYDYATIKHAPNGDTLWVRRYNAPGDNRDEARAIAVDKSGNVYVTGAANGYFATIKYAPNGDTLWVRLETGFTGGGGGANDLAVDEVGNVHVTGWVSPRSYIEDYVTIKYSPNGETLWSNHYDGTGFYSKDRANALAVDYSGNVYVTGQSQGSGTSYDYATIKYAPNGNALWVRRYNGSGNYDDRAFALELDSVGNVYVTGQSQGSGTYYDYTTIKYAPNGDTLWVRRYDGPGNYDDRAYALALDSAGNVYVTGLSEGNGTDYDYATVKYSPTGDTLWVRRYNGPGKSDDRANALALDSDANVYVTGQSVGSGTYYDYATIKYVQFTCVDTAGDANGDGSHNVPDIIFKVNYVFEGGPKPNPSCRGDDNGDTKVNIFDIVYEVNYLFKGGSAPLKSRECCK